MVVYEWKCDECLLLYDQDYPMGKAPNKKKCPVCGNLRSKNFQVTPVHFKGGGWTQTTGYNRAGGSDAVNKRLQDECKNRMESGWQNYARYNPSEGYIKEKKGRRLGQSELRNNLDQAKKVSATTYEKAGIDPHKKRKPQ